MSFQGKGEYSKEQKKAKGSTMGMKSDQRSTGERKKERAGEGQGPYGDGGVGGPSKPGGNSKGGAIIHTINWPGRKPKKGPLTHNIDWPGKVPSVGTGDSRNGNGNGNDQLESGKDSQGHPDDDTYAEGTASDATGSNGMQGYP